MVHEGVICRRHQEAGGNIKGKEGEDKPVNGRALGIMYLEVMKDENLSSKKINSWDEMRKDVDSLIVKIKPTLKANSYGI